MIKGHFEAGGLTKQKEGSQAEMWCSRYSLSVRLMRFLLLQKSYQRQMITRWTLKNKWE